MDDSAKVRAERIINACQVLLSEGLGDIEPAKLVKLIGNAIMKQLCE